VNHQAILDVGSSCDPALDVGCFQAQTPTSHYQVDPKRAGWNSMMRAFATAAGLPVTDEAASGPPHSPAVMSPAELRVLPQDRRRETSARILCIGGTLAYRLSDRGVPHPPARQAPRIPREDLLLARGVITTEPAGAVAGADASAPAEPPISRWRSLGHVDDLPSLFITGRPSRPRTGSVPAHRLNTFVLLLPTADLFFGPFTGSVRRWHRATTGSGHQLT
jgi:hypothetical protein